MSTVSILTTNYTASSSVLSSNGRNTAPTISLQTETATGDILSLSAEGLEATTKFSGLKQPRKIPTQQELEKRTNHFSLIDWALFGVATNIKDMKNGRMSISQFGYGKVFDDMVYAKSRSTLENADSTFNELLKANGIKLGKNEHIELKIDNDGNIVVGGNVGKEKTELIEKILTENKSVGQNLLLSHASRKYAEMGDSDKMDIKAILVNEILQREYGVSLSDFELNENFDMKDPLSPLLLSKNGNDAVLERISKDEFVLVGEIFDVLRSRKNSPDAELPSVTFSYKNGVFIEKGKSDSDALTSFADKVEKTTMWGMENTDYAITVDDTGKINNIEVLAGKNISEWFRKNVLSNNENSFHESTYSPTGKYLKQNTLQRYFLDMQRLAKYETSIEADWNTVTFGRNGNKAFSIVSTQ